MVVEVELVGDTVDGDRRHEAVAGQALDERRAVGVERREPLAGGAEDMDGGRL